MCVSESRDAILSREAADALWQEFFTTAITTAGSVVVETNDIIDLDGAPESPSGLCAPNRETIAPTASPVSCVFSLRHA